MNGDSKAILLLESDEFVHEMVQAVALDQQFALLSALDSDDALRILTSDKPFLFAFNVSCIQGNPVDFVRQLKQNYPETPILTFVGELHKSLAIELVQAGVVACLELPLKPEDFAYNLAKIIANYTETYNPFALFFQERTVVIPNDFALVTQVAKSLTDTSLPPNEKRRFHIILGITEMLNNAIEHGNLGITFEEKSQALKTSQFFHLAVERAHLEPYKNRVVTIRSRTYPSLRRIEFLVSDEGAGFDWRSLPDPKNKENLLKRHGRGIMMARYAFDEISYNEQGNQVLLVAILENPYKSLKI